MTSIIQKNAFQIFQNKNGWFKNKQSIARQRGEAYASVSVKKDENNECNKNKIVIPEKQSPGDSELCSGDIARNPLQFLANYTYRPVFFFFF